MHWAAIGGRFDAIKALKEAGADVSAQTNNGGLTWVVMLC